MQRLKLVLAGLVAMGIVHWSGIHWLWVPAVAVYAGVPLALWLADGGERKKVAEVTRAIQAQTREMEATLRLLQDPDVIPIRRGVCPHCHERLSCAECRKSETCEISNERDIS